MISINLKDNIIFKRNKVIDNAITECATLQKNFLFSGYISSEFIFCVRSDYSCVKEISIW